MTSFPYIPASTYEPLPIDAIRWRCPLDAIPAETTEDIEPIEGIIGQDRAWKALKMGVELFSPGYNIFVCGLAGTGKATTIKQMLEKISPRCNLPKDYCYVNNFRDPDRPVLLAFERGRGKQFHDEMAEAVDMVKKRIPSLFEDSEFVRSRQTLMDEFNQRQMDLFSQFENKIKEDGFVLARIQEGPNLHPELMLKLGDKMAMVSDLPSAIAQGMITEQDAATAEEKYKTYKNELQEVFRRGLMVTREYQKLISEHERKSAEFLLNAIFSELIEKYTDERVLGYLNDVVQNILANLDIFKATSNEGQSEEADLTEYAVNVVLDNSNTEGFPVIIETSPNFLNIFGTVERRQTAQGFLYTDFTQIKPGSLLHADGGYLVLNAADAISEPGVWKTLKRVLLYRKLEIMAMETITQTGVTAIKPEAIDLNVKVILIGNNELYYLLSEYERDFKKIFKVKVDFDFEMDRSEETIRQYTRLLNKLVVDENLRHFDKTAVATIIEYGARIAGNQNKLTTQFSEIADVVREANYWCGTNGNKYVTAKDVDLAIYELWSRHSLSKEKMQEYIRNSVVMVDVEGSRVGQINGLAVYGGDRYPFGKPTRITAAVGVGKAGIINIEREANMSGRTHDKGVLILSGWLRERFAKKRALTLSASISFEQSYGGVDGDSASSTEIYVLLSALSDIPIRQQFAVTGSVNQKGDIQPIGGVNEKIEGYFDVCNERGLTGNQGVLIPHQNVANLMLKDEVVQAVAEGRFSIYPVRRIEEGIEILTGVKAGEAGADDTFEADTVFGRVAARLVQLAESVDTPKEKQAGKKAKAAASRKGGKKKS